MRVLVIPSPMLPWPPVKGGAVQNLIRFYAEWNENANSSKEIEVVSIYNKEAKISASLFKHTRVKFIDIPNVLFTVRDTFSGKLAGIASRLIDFFYLKGIKKILNQSSAYDVAIFENTPGYVLELKKVLEVLNQ